MTLFGLQNGDDVQGTFKYVSLLNLPYSTVQTQCVVTNIHFLTTYQGRQEKFGGGQDLFSGVHLHQHIRSSKHIHCDYG